MSGPAVADDRRVDKHGIPFQHRLPDAIPSLSRCGGMRWIRYPSPDPLLRVIHFTQLAETRTLKCVKVDLIHRDAVIHS